MSTPPKYTYPVTVGSEQKARILKYLAGSETGGNEKKAYSTQHAGTANSGYSLGQTQIDLAHRTRERSELVDFLRRQGTFSQDELAKLEQGLGSKGNNAAITDVLKNKLDGAIDRRFRAGAGLPVRERCAGRTQESTGEHPDRLACRPPIHVRYLVPNRRSPASPRPGTM